MAHRLLKAPSTKLSEPPPYHCIIQEECTAVLPLGRAGEKWRLLPSFKLPIWDLPVHLRVMMTMELEIQMHVEWLKAAIESISLPSEAAGAAGVHLLQLAGLIRTALIQIDAVALPPPRSSLPTVSSAFDVLRYSVEMSRSLKVFCHWSKRLVRHLHIKALCPPSRSP